MLSKGKFLANHFKSFSYSGGNLCDRLYTTSAYIYPRKEDEFTSTPQYPPIEKTGPEYEKEKEMKEWFKKIKRQLTVEEKLFEVNVPRYMGWKCFMIHEGIIPFDNLVFAQHMTRTHIIKTQTLPDCYSKSIQKCSDYLQQIKNDVIDSITYQLHGVRRNESFKNMKPADKEKEMTKIVVNELNRVILRSLMQNEDYFKNLQCDFLPRIEASWKINSLVETYIRKEYKDGIPADELPEEYLDRPSDKLIQYIGHPILQIRHTNPIPNCMSLKEANILNYSVPFYNYDPSIVLGYEMERRYLTNIPGFWPGDDRDFSFMSYHDLNHIKYRPSSYGSDDTEEAICSHAILASFGWLMSLACYHGFSSYHNVTYPLVTQTVLTDGKKFVFAVYQLNTTELYHENHFENIRSNICWLTQPMDLYETLENGKLKGFNEEVLCMLLQFYCNTPEPTANLKLKPYLGDSIKYIAHYEDDEKREWLENKFKHYSANKPYSRPDLLYEVQDWERIYKIMFATRPIDARKRPFELHQNPYHTKMSDCRGRYIPKAIRPDKHLPKYKQRKFVKTFYPE